MTKRRPATQPSGSRIFLLSPASCSGRRARLLLSERATFDLAHRLQSPEGAPLGEVFSFLSGLYFRGKLTYARRFAAPPDPSCPVASGGVLVITPTAGLRSPDVHISQGALQAFAAVDVDPRNPAYRAPLETSARELASRVGPRCVAVLLGSIASAKYVEILTGIFGERVCFPVAFVGRGDMSRGGLLLRAAAARHELEYVPVLGAVRHGPRPPKLTRQVL